MGRLDYQRYKAIGSVLNIGSGENPAGLAGVHLDKKFYPGVPNLIIADAHHLPFQQHSFDTVILGDVLEHVLKPHQVLTEARRVVRRRVIITVPYDNRLPPGQHVREAMALDHDRQHPTINFFSDDWLRELVASIRGHITNWQYVPEHNWMNWLITVDFDGAT